jgi:hypothetical protein
VPDDFESLLAWLHERVGDEVSISVGGPPDGETNVGLHARGTLRRGDGEVTLIDPAPGEVVTFRVGDSTVVLLEGDLVEVELEEVRTTRVGDGEIRLPASASADFGEVSVLFSAKR